MITLSIYHSEIWFVNNYYLYDTRTELRVPHQRYNSAYGNYTSFLYKNEYLNLMEFIEALPEKYQSCAFFYLERLRKL